MESIALAETFELNTEDLIKAAIENGEGTIASNGALSLETGSRTGRSPNDRFIVEEDSTSHLIDWGEINRPFDADKFSLLWDKVDAYLAEKNRYLSKVHVGAHADHYIPVNVTAESASHSMFSQLIFISPDEFNPQVKKEWADRIIFVDGGSKDGTIEKAKELGFEVIHQNEVSQSEGSHERFLSTSWEPIRIKVDFSCNNETIFKFFISLFIFLKISRVWIRRKRIL